MPAFTEAFIDSHDFKTELSDSAASAFMAEGFDASAGRVNASDRPDLADFQYFFSTQARDRDTAMHQRNDDALHLKHLEGLPQRDAADA